MTLKHILFFSSTLAVDQKIREHVQKILKAKGPDDDDYDFAEDDDDDPADFSPDQFLGDNSFLQTGSKVKSKNIRDDEVEHYFNTIDGEEEDEDYDAEYDDSFVQLALKTHVEFDDMVAKGKLNFSQKKNRGPDDDDYDFAEDDDDDPADFSVGQFLDDESFIQTRTRSKDDDDDYADDRLGAGDFMPVSMVNTGDSVANDDDDEASDDSVHQVLLQEARRHHQKHHGKHHKKHKQSELAKKITVRKFERQARGITDVYHQLASYEKAHPDLNDNRHWLPADADDGESFLQLDEEDVVEDDDDSLADDRLDNNNEKPSEWPTIDDDSAFIQTGDKPAEAKPTEAKPTEAQPTAAKSTEVTKEKAETDDSGDASDEVTLDEEASEE